MKFVGVPSGHALCGDNPLDLSFFSEFVDRKACAERSTRA